MATATDYVAKTQGGVPVYESVPAGSVPVVSTPTAAIEDLNQKQNALTQITNGMASQNINRQTADQQREFVQAQASSAFAGLTPEQKAQFGGDINQFLTAVQGEQARAGLNQDVAIGNLLSKTNTATAQPVEQPTMTKDEMVDDLLVNRYGQAPETAAAEAQPEVDPITQQLQELDQQTTSAYEQYKKDIASLQNGTFPLSALEQSQVQNLMAKFEALKQQQITANKNFQGALAVSQARGGQAEFTPEIAAGNVKQAIDDGIAKIASLEVMAMTAVNDLQQGFADRNYKMINDAYDRYTKFTDGRQKALTDMQTAASKAAQDLRDFEYKVEQDAFNNMIKLEEFDATQAKTAFDQMMKVEEFNFDVKQKGIENMLNSNKFTWQQKMDNLRYALDVNEFTADEEERLRQYELDLRRVESGELIETKDAFGNPRFYNTRTGEFEGNVFEQAASPMGLEAPENYVYQQGISAALEGFSSEAERNRILQNVDKMLKEGDYDRAADTILRTAAKAAPAAEQAKMLGRKTMMDSLADIKSALDVYVAKSGDTGILKGTLEGAMNKIGRSTDPELAKIKTLIESSLITFRSQISGAAFTESEMKQYANLWPSIENKNDLNLAKIETLTQNLNRDTRSAYSMWLGDTNYDAVMGDMAMRNIPPLTESYATPEEIVAARPDYAPKIEALIDEGLSDEDIMQVLYGDTGTFNKPLGTGEKGLEDLAGSIIEQESGGDYSAVGDVPAGHSEADKALGRYQIVPKYHFAKIGLANTPANRQKFLNSPALQDKLFQMILADLGKQYNNDPRKIAAAYYGGAGGAAKVGTKAGDAPQYAGGKKYPSINSYVNSVMSRLA